MSLDNFPLVVPLTSKRTVYSGLVTIKERAYKIRITLKKPQKLTGVNVSGCPEIENALIMCKKDIEQYIKTEPNLGSFLKKLVSRVEEVMSAETDSKIREPLSSTLLHARLVKELTDIKWENVISFDQSRVVLQYVDSDRRGHELELSIPDDYANSSRTSLVQVTKLQLPFTGSNSGADINSKTINFAFERFAAYCEGFQEFWSQIENLDKQTWIIEPEQVNFAVHTVIIVLESGISAEVKVNPIAPTAAPECHFLGPDETASSIRKEYNENVEHMWDDESGVPENLFRCIPTNVLRREEVVIHEEEEKLSCIICKSIAIKEAIYCLQSHCLVRYHEGCLREWLLTQTSSTQVIGSFILGKCVSCQGDVQVAQTF